MKFIIFLLAAITIAKGVSVAGQITGKVVSVIDGNTIEIESNERGLDKIVLSGVDCPELGQEFGTEARKFVEKLVLGQVVVVELQGKDRNGNHLGIVLLNEDDDIRLNLLKAGLAWTEERNPQADLEAYRYWAQQKGKGLWRNPAATAPWTFRRQQTMVQPKSS